MKTITIDDNHGILDMMRFVLKQIDPNGTHFFADSAEKGVSLIEKEAIRIVFLDIEMPEMTGEEAAKQLLEKYGTIDVIFITGHEEYALSAHRLHCSGFVTKPFGEEDIAEALKWLRYPENIMPDLRANCREHFALYVNGQPLQFKKERTAELFAYLFYKHGADVTNDEMISILWGDEPDRQDLLRKYIKDIRDCLAEVGADSILSKKRGAICLNISQIKVDGDTANIAVHYGWFE